MDKFYLVHRKNAPDGFNCDSKYRYQTRNDALAAAYRLCVKEETEFEILEVKMIGSYVPAKYINNQTNSDLD
jgi:hypothetical protein